MPDFEAWYRSDYQRLVNTVALVVGDRTVAADAVGDAFTKALARWERVGAMEYPAAWVCRVAINDARRMLRRRAHERRLLAADPELVANPSMPPVESDLELWAAVARLPERTRTAVVLRYVADLTEPAIAEAMKVRRGTVATLLKRARERLSEELSTPASSHTEEISHVVSS